MAGQDQIVAPAAATLDGSEYVLISQQGVLRRIPLSTLLQQMLILNMALPTSNTGLPTGALWNNTGVVNVK